jgi:hypothetical protein
MKELGLVSEIQIQKAIDSLDKRIDYVTKVSWALTLSVLATLVAQVLMRMFMP